MKKIISLITLAIVAATSFAFCPEAKAESGKRGEITVKSVGAGVLSLLVWPGIGQAVNDQPGKKVGWHALVGLLPPFRFWSAYDAMYQREGGYWEGKI